MKTLTQIIQEKLYIKAPVLSSFTPEQFLIICMYILSYIKEEDLIKDYVKNKCIYWGEIDRYSVYNINFSKYPFMTDIAFNMDDDECVERLELMDNFANAVTNLYIEITRIELSSRTAHNRVKTILWYLAEYVKNSSNLNNENIDWLQIDEIKNEYETIHLHLVKWWENLFNSSNTESSYKKIFKYIEEVGKTAIQLMQ